MPIPNWKQDRKERVPLMYRGVPFDVLFLVILVWLVARYA